MQLFDVEHQWPAQRRLQRALGGGRVPHAYLFAGPEGVGKAMLAERFARLLLCPHPTPVDPPPAPATAVTDGGSDPRTEPPSARAVSFRDACGACEDCRLFDAATHPDYHPIHRGLHRYHPDKTIQNRKGIELGVEVVRHFLIAQVGHRPARGRAKVFVVLEADRLNSEAQNALLKTLEEPPQSSYLILVGSTAARLLATTASRCQIIPFDPLPISFVADRLTREAGVRPDDAAYLAGLAEGCCGPALRWARLGVAARRGDLLGELEQADRDPLRLSRQLRLMAEGLAKQIAESETAEVSEAEATRSAYRIVLPMLACALRDALRLASGADAAAHGDAASLPRVRRLADRLGRAGAGRAIRGVAAAERSIEQNANANLAIDQLAIEVARSVGARSFAA